VKEIAQACVLIACLASVCFAQESKKKSECNFSKYASVFKSHIVVPSEPRYVFLEKSVQPEYPAIARAARIQGEVKVNILINPKGNVSDACAAEGHPLLQVASVRAALGWRFKRFSGKSEYKHQHLQSQLAFYFSLE
jgi:TonB family protein